MSLVLRGFISVQSILINITKICYYMHPFEMATGSRKFDVNFDKFISFREIGINDVIRAFTLVEEAYRRHQSEKTLNSLPLLIGKCETFSERRFIIR